MNFFQTGLPGLPDDEGSVAVVNSTGHVIDFFYYNRNFHSKMIRDEEGVSLERISFSNPTNDDQNWKSASAQSGFATPGLLNSNSRPELLTGKRSKSILRPLVQTILPGSITILSRPVISPTSGS